ncbi:unnamed protein product [Lampetra planeri]
MVGLERASKMQNYLEHIVSLRISRCQVKPSSMLLITTEPHIMMGCISPIELILLLLVTVPTLACPSACRCNGDFVYCNDRGLTSIPSGMPRNATTLYLQNNQINNAGIPPEMRNLLKVETVYLYSNRLEEFPINLPRNALLELAGGSQEAFGRAMPVAVEMERGGNNGECDGEENKGDMGEVFREKKWKW